MIIIGNPKPRRKNQFKLSITCMLGDADSYKTINTYFDKFEGELEEFYKLVYNAMQTDKNRNKYLTIEQMNDKLVNDIINNSVLKIICPTTDHAAEYLWDRLLIGEHDCGYWKPDEIKIIYINDDGDKCPVTVNDK